MRCFHVFDDLHVGQTTSSDGVGDKVKSLVRIWINWCPDYDRLSENFRQTGGFTYEADIRAILNGFKFDESMWQMKIAELSN